MKPKNSLLLQFILPHRSDEGDHEQEIKLKGANEMGKNKPKDKNQRS
jgi:hypothetical protein